MEEHGLINNHRSGHSEIEAASLLPTDSDEWLPVMQSVLMLEPWMVPAVQSVVKQRKWERSANPVGYIRTAARREARRIGLLEDGDQPRSDRRCRCGRMDHRTAKKRGHVCKSVKEFAIADIKLPVSAWQNDGATYKGKMGAEAYHAAHDRFIENQINNYLTETTEKVPERIIQDEETGIFYSGEPYLYNVPEALLKRWEPVGRSENPSDQETAEMLKIAYPQSTGMWMDGMLTVDWQKVAELLPIKEEAKPRVAATLEMRINMLLKFRDACDILNWFEGFSPEPRKAKAQLQAAWKMIDRYQKELARILNPLQPIRHPPEPRNTSGNFLDGGPIRPPLRAR